VHDRTFSGKPVNIFRIARIFVYQGQQKMPPGMGTRALTGERGRPRRRATFLKSTKHRKKQKCSRDASSMNNAVAVFDADAVETL